MATFPSSISRFRTSSPSAQIDQGILVTTVTPLRKMPNHQPVPRSASLFTLPKEPEDARLTGGTRSLDRRLLALNLSGSLAKPAVSVKRAPTPLHSAVA
ncbi:MAG TPA: hypothetical protein VF865_18080 [Acidobacteriaceae bacterium]